MYIIGKLEAQSHSNHMLLQQVREMSIQSASLFLNNHLRDFNNLE